MKEAKKPSKIVQSWRWRIVKAGLTMERFAESTGRTQAQFSDWVRGVKQPKPESIEAVERDLKKLGV